MEHDLNKSLEYTVFLFIVEIVQIPDFESGILHQTHIQKILFLMVAQVSLLNVACCF